MNKVFIFFLFSIFSCACFSQTTLISQGSAWKYFDQGQVSPQWNTITFDDNSWATGNTELGYGDGDEATSVGYGPNSSDKYITTYLRKTIDIANPSQFAFLTLNLLRDDGAVVYVNGTEIWRSNMPGGTINFNTWADGTIMWPYEDDWHSLNISSSYLLAGENVIAVEVHQDDPSSSDISFNFSMIAHLAQSVAVSRGPYLQKATQNSVIIRWRTDAACDARVSYGISPANLNNEVAVPNFLTDHVIELTDLNPNTTYYYSIETGNSVLASGSNMFFKTLPESGNDGVYKFAVIGDAGTGYQEQLDTKNALINHNNSNHFDGLLLLGDNAYQGGFDSEYQSYFFDNKYNEIFENTIIWPAPGNHDFNNHIPFSPSPAYFDIFNCPTNGECGGLASGTENYYSYDYGNIHFVSLDSYDESRAVDGNMANWLEQDLALTTQEWKIVYFHHPPYTKGSHDSDNTFFLDGELVEMRENILPILENHGVDLVLNGHSHSYERSMLIDGHYGESSSFGSDYIKDATGGSYPQECPYQKITDQTTGNANLGTVYTVLGCSGKLSGIQSDWPHPAMHSYTNEHVGSMILTIEKNRLDAVFVTGQGEEFDNFSIIKNAGIDTTIYTCINEPVVLNASWPENLNWNPGGQQGNSFTITPLTNSIVIATDDLNCIEDKFQIILLENDSCNQINTLSEYNLTEPKVFNSGGLITIEHNFHKDLTFELYSIQGALIRRFNVQNPKHIEDISALPKGIYILKPKDYQFIYKLNNYD